MKTRLFLLPIIIFCFSAVASAKDCGRRFRIIVNNYAPLFDVNNEGHVHGLTFEFMNELSVRLGCIVSQAPMDAPRMHDDFKNWRADIVGLVIPSEKFRSSGEYVPVYSTVRKLLVNKAFYDPARSIADYIKDGRIKFGDQIGTRFFFEASRKRSAYRSGPNCRISKPGNRLSSGCFGARSGDVHFASSVQLLSKSDS
ncbi:hypothetical protein [Bdellovibrio bacteriovorus]|uniref:hypothetical protein n=1 Tax=Bdellovibrio bacteriovorus TaxID=959 RepID=UPI0035A5E5CB